MTRFEYLQNQKNYCLSMAEKTNDISLKIFYKNAAEGYRQKIAKLTVCEAGE